MTGKELADAKEGGLGPRWPKGMWDNMDSKSSMIKAMDAVPVDRQKRLNSTPLYRRSLAHDHGAVRLRRHPDCYNRQFELDFRAGPERVSFSQLERTRRKVRKWMAENTQHFAL